MNAAVDPPRIAGQVVSEYFGVQVKTSLEFLTVLNADSPTDGYFIVEVGAPEKGISAYVRVSQECGRTLEFIVFPSGMGWLDFRSVEKRQAAMLSEGLFAERSESVELQEEHLWVPSISWLSQFAPMSQLKVGSRNVWVENIFALCSCS